MCFSTLASKVSQQRATWEVGNTFPDTLRQNSDSGIVMVDGTFLDDSFEQDRSWDDFGTTISGI